MTADFQTVLAHCLWMAQHEPAYARKAAKWYGQALDLPELLAEFDRLTTFPQPPTT